MLKFKVVFLISLSFLAIGCKVEDTQGPEVTNFVNVDLFHGYYDVGPNQYFYIKFEAFKGDTLYFEARVRDGDGSISYAFWADSVNYIKWLNGDSSATLHDYREAVSSVAYVTALDSAVYYVILGNSDVVRTKRYWVRSYIRGQR